MCSIEPSRTLYYQLSVSAIAFLLLSWFVEPVAITRLTPLIIAAILFQGLFVAFVTYLVWFWLIAQYPAARLSAFTFLTPLFGVIAGVVLLSEPATAGLLSALVLVGAGIYLVNNRKK